MSLNDRHSRLAELFEAALEAAPEHRDALLRKESAGDDELVREVSELLRHHDSDDGEDGVSAALRQPILAGPVNIRAVIDAAAATRGEPSLNIDIPGYRVLRVLGEGGMGVVYLAEQDKPRRQVAIKLMRPGVTSPSLLKRFDLEQEVLGRLQHPGIAQIFGAGVCQPFGESGPTQPFFAMEYVEGQLLGDYCNSHRLGSSERLRLLLKVCDAVQHAHAKGVVHRDLKPGNILVKDGDDEAEIRRDEVNSAPSTIEQPTSSLRPSASPSLARTKILDFGVARATDTDILATTLNTGVGQLIGTLAYMSPEQAAGDSSKIDARSDIYALGAIGYELLAGQLPHHLKGKGVADAARIIRDEEPEALSSINRFFRGDLDTIFAKALAKEPQRRYQTAAEFAADIQRYLDDQPIHARPSSAIYNLRKFARRNTGLVAGVALAFVVLVAGVIGTTLAMLEARRQRDDAQIAKTAAVHDAETAQAVTQFLQEMLSAPDPLARIDVVTDDPKQTRIIDMLDSAADLVGERFADRPVVEGDIRAVLARTFSHLGEHDKAEPMLRRAIELYDQELGEDSLRALDTRGALGTLYMMQHRFDEADSILSLQVDRYRELFGQSDARMLTSMEQLGLMRSQRMDFDGAKVVLKELLELRRQTLGPLHEDTLNTLYNVGWVDVKAGRFAEALPVCLEVYEAGKSAFGPVDQRTISYANNIAFLYERLNREEEAERMHAANVDLARTTMEASDWHLGTYLHNHASVLRRLKRYAEAEPRELEAISIFEKNFEPGNNRMQTAVKGAITLYEEWGRPEEAEKWRARLESKATAPGPETRPASGSK